MVLPRHSYARRLVAVTGLRLAVKSFANLSLDTEYRTGQNDPVELFYRPCLSLATRYDRAAGYFRSSIFHIIGEHVLEFAKRGGRMRLVCSPSVTADDVNAIAKGYEARTQFLQHSLGKDIEELLAQPSLTSRTKVLATLIQAHALEIRFAIRSDGDGIYHEKAGVFTDAEGAHVSFLGSANETWSAWHYKGNHESVEVFRDSGSSPDAARVSKHMANFERLWEGNVPGVETLKFPEAQRRMLLKQAVPDLHDLYFEEPPEPEPPSPPRREPMPHQIAAIEAWEAAGRRGVFEHATGSGKTFTAITAAKKHLRNGGPALILVPSRLLLAQWADEVGAEIPDASLLLAGAGNVKWKDGGRLRAHTSGAIDLRRITIATMQTAATDAFLRAVADGPHLMLIADEVHQIGSAFNSKAMALDSGASMGLSATPTRYGDPEGTQRIFDRFGPVLPPPITLQDAIRSGRLVPYEYHPHPVHLDEPEAADWKKLTKQISLEVARSSNDESAKGRMSDKVKMLLIQRSRIAKKARAKPGLAAGVIDRDFEAGQRWLVYCEDSEQLAETMGLLAGMGRAPVEYHSGMKGDRAAALAWFREFGGVLVSIKCLDEGVDIPSVTHAFILASSQNPRQFIQRRGRVLRASHGKYSAVIHDAIVVPLAGDEDSGQTSLLRAELVRALQFAASALNKAAGAHLRSIALDLNFDIEHGAETGIEEETEEEE